MAIGFLGSIDNFYTRHREAPLPDSLLLRIAVVVKKILLVVFVGPVVFLIVKPILRICRRDPSDLYQPLNNLPPPPPSRPSTVESEGSTHPRTVIVGSATQATVPGSRPPSPPAPPMGGPPLPPASIIDPPMVRAPSPLAPPSPPREVATPVEVDAPHSPPPPVSAHSGSGELHPTPPPAVNRSQTSSPDNTSSNRNEADAARVDTVSGDVFQRAPNSPTISWFVSRSPSPPSSAGSLVSSTGAVVAFDGQEFEFDPLLTELPSQTRPTSPSFMPIPFGRGDAGAAVSETISLVDTNGVESSPSPVPARDLSRPVSPRISPWSLELPATPDPPLLPGVVDLPPLPASPPPAAEVLTTRYRPIGISSEGHVCFIASSVQILMAAYPGLVADLINYRGDDFSPPLQALQRVLAAYTEGREINQADIVSIRGINSEFMNENEGCINEFLTRLSGVLSRYDGFRRHFINVIHQEMIRYDLNGQLTEIEEGSPTLDASNFLVEVASPDGNILRGFQEAPLGTVYTKYSISASEEGAIPQTVNVYCPYVAGRTPPPFQTDTLPTDSRAQYIATAVVHFHPTEQHYYVRIRLRALDGTDIFYQIDGPTAERIDEDRFLDPTNILMVSYQREDA